MVAILRDVLNTSYQRLIVSLIQDATRGWTLSSDQTQLFRQFTFGQLNGFDARPRFANDRDIGLMTQNHCKPTTHERLIVDDGDSDGHDRDTGMSAFTLKPPP